MFKFVASDGTGSIKRQQASRACESCRKRKKRCDHSTDSGKPNSPARKLAPSQAYNPTQTSSSHSSTNDPPGRSNGVQEQSSAQSTKHLNPITSITNLDNSDQDLEVARILSGGAHIRASASELQGPPVQQSRFIGDLSPEGIFLAATNNPDTTRPSSDSPGVWLSQKIGKRAAAQVSTVHQSSSNLFYKSSSLVKDVVVPLLEQECLSTLPPRANFEHLSAIYFEKIHPIFPIIDESMYHKLNSTDACLVLLRQGICLAASKNVAAREHLVLSGSDQPMTCRDFGEKIAGTMRLVIELGIVTSKVVLVQAFALLSQFIDNPPGEDLTSQLCSKAVHCLQSMGLHIQGHQDNANTRLLCCVYAIDRMNAAFHGRAVFMHERDISKNLAECFQQQEPCFRLLLQVISQLDRVIAIYRPSENWDQHILDSNFPSFEDLVSNCRDFPISTASLATLEIFYHAVAILSYRSRVWSDPNRSSGSYSRQSLSTSVLSSITQHELQDQLVLFPFVPYALSLSLSIAYREMRHNKLTTHRKRARTQFQLICKLLSDLEDVYWTASTAAAMGKKMLKEIDRVFSAVSENNKTAQQEGTNSMAPRGPSNPTTITGTGTPTSEVIDVEPIQDFDLAAFDLGPDVDVFGLFDPAFDLDGFDACLEGNLNLGYPTSYQ